MKFEFVIPESSIESTKLMLQGEKQGYDAFYLSLCGAHVTIMSEREEEPNFAFGRIPFLNLLSDFKFFIRENGNKDYAKGTINDMDQSYGIRLDKERSKLMLRPLKTLHRPPVLTLKCPEKAHHFDYPAGLFLAQYLRECPELEKSKQWEFIRKDFNVKR